MHVEVAAVVGCGVELAAVVGWGVGPAARGAWGVETAAEAGAAAAAPGAACCLQSRPGTVLHAPPQMPSSKRPRGWARGHTCGRCLQRDRGTHTARAAVSGGQGACAAACLHPCVPA